MNSIERLLSVTHFQESDRPPVIPELLGVVATIANVSVRDYVTSGQAIATLQLEAQSRIGHDAVFAAADLCVEAEALGCNIKYPKDNYPYVTKTILENISGLESLLMPDPHSSGRMPEIIKATSIMKREVGGVIPVFAHVVGPITLAARIIDTEKMLYMIVDHPDEFKYILEFCRRVLENYAIELLKAGADGILMFDPVASMSLIPPRIFTEYEAEPVQAIFSALRKYNPNVIIWYSVAGMLEADFSMPISIGSDIFTIDYVVPMDVALKHSNSVVINGNIKPALFSDGTPDDIKEEARKLLALGRSTERFILGSGCEVPLYSPVDNIKALVDVAKEESLCFDVVNPPVVGTNEVMILPHKKKVYLHNGSSLLDAIEKASIPVTSYCDRSGSCGKCIVTVHSGEISPRSEIESVQLRTQMVPDGNRLACITKVFGSAEIYIPYLNRIYKSRLTVLDELLSQTISNIKDLYGFLPNIFCESIDMDELDEEPPISYQEWLRDKLSLYSIDSVLVDDFASIATSSQKQVYAIVDREQKAIISFSTSKPVLGLAIDIGTTTISAYVHDLQEDKPVCAGSVENPQKELGLDIISRVAYIAKDPKALPRMQRKLLEGINNLIDAFRREKSIDCTSVYCMTVVGNPVIIHMLLGLSPVKLSQSPYIPTISLAISTTADRLKSSVILSVPPKCRIEVLPSIGGFVGADVVAGILSSGIYENDDIALFIDIGTNGEIALGNRDRILCASVSAGSAFEGALLTHGLAYQNGVIDKVKINSSKEIVFETVGNALPIGLCGSGVIDAIAEFCRLGIINRRGRFSDSGMWIQVKGDLFVLVKKENTAMFNSIYITERDIEEIQKAKSAFKTGITLLMKEMAISCDDIKKVFLSGSFGFSTNINNATKIGMIPELNNAEFEIIKNSAGQGARIALLSRNAWERASEIADKAEHVNLATHDEFNDLFIDNMLFDIEI